MSEEEVLQRRLALRTKVPILAVALELAVFKIVPAPEGGQRKYWVTDCPICTAEGHSLRSCHRTRFNAGPVARRATPRP